MDGYICEPSTCEGLLSGRRRGLMFNARALDSHLTAATGCQVANATLSGISRCPRITVTQIRSPAGCIPGFCFPEVAYSMQPASIWENSKQLQAFIHSQMNGVWIHLIVAISHGINIYKNGLLKTQLKLLGCNLDCPLEWDLTNRLNSWASKAETLITNCL